MTDEAAGHKEVGHKAYRFHVASAAFRRAKQLLAGGEGCLSDILLGWPAGGALLEREKIRDVYRSYKSAWERRAKQEAGSFKNAARDGREAQSAARVARRGIKKKRAARLPQPAWGVKQQPATDAGSAPMTRREKHKRPTDARRKRKNRKDL